MSSPTPGVTSTRFAAFVERGFSLEHVALRQVPFTVVFVIVLVVGLLDTGAPNRPLEAAVAVAVVAVAQVAAIVMPWHRLPLLAQGTLSIAHLAALMLLEAGTGVLLSVPLFLVIVSLAVLPGIGALALAVAVALVGVLVVFGVGDRPVGTEAEVVLPTAILVAIGVHGITSRIRAQREALVALRGRQDAIISELRESRTALAESADRWRVLGEQWRSLIDAATGQAIIATDQDGRIEIFNPGAERMLGRTQQEAVGMSVTDLHDPDELAAATTERGLADGPAGRFQVLVEELASTDSVARNWTYLRRDGERVPVQVNVTRRPDLDSGDAGGYLLVATDITEQVESERLQDEFVGLVSHELRTPLVSVLGYVDLLRAESDRLDPDQLDYVETIDRSGQRLLRLVNDLLLSVQVSAGRFSLVLDDTDVATIARQSVAAISPTAVAAGVELRLEAPAPVRVRADPMRIGQLLENLLSNAVKFTLAGGQVTVRVAEGVDGHGVTAAVISVADTGIGIGPDELTKLTERFYRARSARSRRIRGIGLGLPIAQAIVDAHQGELSVQSELGTGTTFTVTIPDRRDQRDQPPTSRPRPAPEPPSAPPSSGTPE